MKTKNLLSTALLVFHSSIIFSQHVYTGRVVDAQTKKGISDALVRIHGADSILKTNFLGYFQVNADSSDYFVIEKQFYETGIAKCGNHERIQILLSKRKRAEFISGDEQFRNFIRQAIRYPAQARQNKIEGSFIASFTVDSLGNIGEIKGLEGSEPLFTQSVTDALFETTNMWLPAEKTVAFIVPITFSFEKPKRATAFASRPGSIMLEGINVVAVGIDGIATEPELKRRLKTKGGVVEEYSVMAHDKSIKHGPYAKYRNHPLSKIPLMLETCTYSHGLREGTAFSYYMWMREMSATNNLKEVVSYRNGKKDGASVFYYFDSLNSVIEIDRSNYKKEVKINIEQAGLKPMLESFYKDDRPCGIWTSYNIDGSVYQRYDFDGKFLLFDKSLTDATNTEGNQPALFVGGWPYFRSLAFERMMENNHSFQFDSYDSVRAEVEISISADGTLSAAFIPNVHVPETFTKNMLSFINETQGMWLAATSAGVPAHSKRRISFLVKRNGYWLQFYVEIEET